MQYLINSLHDLKGYQTGKNKINLKVSEFSPISAILNTNTVSINTENILT